MRIGITERGDAAIDLSWSSKMHSVDGAILITKQCCNDDFLRHVLRWKDKVIVHCTITGYGGGWIEPHVPTHYDTIPAIRKLVSLLGPTRVVLRIDPIIPNEAGCTWIPYLINEATGVRRVRFSIIDNYKHLKSRGLYLPWAGFNAPEKMVEKVVQKFMPYTTTHNIECCCESYSVIPDGWRRGCVSLLDLDILGLPAKALQFPISNQRKDCECLSIKTELLSNRNQCPHGCLYCYWK